MPSPNAMNKKDIDAVITWVDGSSQKHTQRRQKYMADVIGPLHENAINPHRWACNQEILFCLQSIYNFAPWIRKIWIVVDSETPNISALPVNLQKKIFFVFHQEIFKEYSDNLPTFNSVSIETFLWRISELSDRFLYFNDDVFLTAPVHPSDLFVDDIPVLRGNWVDYTSIVKNKKSIADPAKFNNYMQINSANILGFNANHVFDAAHVVHPFQRSTMSELFGLYQKEFLQNVTYRFRDLNQFSPQALYNHACVSRKQAVLQSNQDHLHIYSGQEADSSPGELKNLLDEAYRDNNIKFLCINDLPKLERVIPNIKNLVANLVGGFEGHPDSNKNPFYSV